MSVLWLTAGLFHQMVDEERENLLGVRQLLAGGDVLSAGHVRKYLSGGWAGVNQRLRADGEYDVHVL